MTVFGQHSTVPLLYANRASVAPRTRTACQEPSMHSWPQGSEETMLGKELAGQAISCLFWIGKLLTGRNEGLLHKEDTSHL